MESGDHKLVLDVNQNDSIRTERRKKKRRATGVKKFAGISRIFHLNEFIIFIVSNVYDLKRV